LPINGRRARKAIALAFTDRALACSDISLWKIAMLIARKRLDPVMDAPVWPRWLFSRSVTASGRRLSANIARGHLRES
jgi:hypothetical protein